MVDSIILYVSQHWFLSTYLGTMIFNEGAILTVFSLSINGGWYYYAGVVFVVVLGVLSNDLLLYAIGHFGSKKFCRAYEIKADESQAVKTIFQKIFFRNIFLTLLFIKFFFGVRLILTLYLITRKKIPFVKYFLYSLCGIILYVGVLSVISLLIMNGVGGTMGIYSVTERIIGGVVGIIILMHAFSFIIGKYAILKNKE